MKTMVNCTYVRLKILKILTAHRRDIDIVNKYVMQLQYFKSDAISSMWEFSGQLEWKQGPNSFDYGLSQTSFQLHRIEPGDVKNQKSINGTPKSIAHICKIPIFIQLLCTKETFPSQRLGKGKCIKQTINDSINSSVGRITRQCN